MPETSEYLATKTAPEGELGQYRLVAELARGGMGIVYLAVLRGPAGFSKLFAIKVLKPDLTEDETLLLMFLDEARLAARLEHANIARTIEAGVDRNRVFMVMEHLEGQTVHRLLARLRARGGLALDAHVRILANALDGLNYAHEIHDADGQPYRIVHRDVTPHNLFVTYNGHVKVMDFGIAKAVGRSHETRTGVLKGKIAYMSPEQVNGDPVDHRADLFAVGVMLWEALTRQRMWQNKTDLEILNCLANNDIPDPREVAPDAPEALCLVCDRALAPHVANRYASAADMRADLEAYLDTRSTRVTPASLAALVSKTFAADRARMNALVDEYLARVREAEINNVGDDGPTLVMPNSFHPMLMHPPPVAAELTPSYDEIAPVEPHGPSFPPRRFVMPALAALAATLVTVAVALVIYARSHRDIGTAEQAPIDDTTTLATATSAAPADDTTQIELTARAAPPNASFTLDDVALKGNPHKGMYARDSSVHQLRATADGYEAKSVDVLFDNNLVIDLVLERAGSASAVVTSPRRKAAPKRQRVGGSGGSSPVQRLPRRPIDPSTPYGGR